MPIFYDRYEVCGDECAAENCPYEANSNSKYCFEHQMIIADPFQNTVPCWQYYGLTQREIDLAQYGFTTRYY